METKWAAVVVAAGRGSRMKRKEKKQFLPLGDKPVLVHTLEMIARCGRFAAIVVVVGADDVERVQNDCQRYDGIPAAVRVVAGGGERQDSVYCGLRALDSDTPYVLVHDGVRPFVRPDQVRKCMDKAEQTGAAVLAIPVHDTIKQVDEQGVIQSTLERKSLRAIQTPQAFRLSLLLEAHRSAEEAAFFGTDDAMLVERIGHPVHVVDGDAANRKITTPEDLVWSEWMAERRTTRPMIRVGQGYDVHRLIEGRPCIIGGVNIPHDQGLDGHSDADVLLHAITDAVLGALGKGDIGRHFPDTDPAYKDADSAQLLAKVWEMATQDGYRLANVDATVIAERPKMAAHIPSITKRIADLLEADEAQVNVKATTSERLGFVGREEGIAAQAVVCLQKSVLSF